MYTLNNISLEELGLIPSLIEGSTIAMSGFLDMPSRVGKTFHDWADENGIEPYVSASEIFFGGRDINLEGYVQGIDWDHCANKTKAIINLIDSFTGLVPLVSDWGTNNVYVNGAVKVETLHSTTNKIYLPFREPIVDLTGVLPLASNSEFGIDGISFATMGATLLELTGDTKNRTAPKSQKFTAYGKEGYQITKTVAPELNLKLYISQSTYASFKARIKGLYKLFSATGIRSLTVGEDQLRSFFVKDGFTVTNIYTSSNLFFGIVNCKLTQVIDQTAFTELTDTLGELITDINNNQITVRL